MDLLAGAKKRGFDLKQISFNPYNYRGHKELIKFAGEHGILLEAYSALAYVRNRFC
jgi:diketogulonate reductase-like aldo/keto reductase